MAGKKGPKKKSSGIPQAGNNHREYRVIIEQVSRLEKSLDGIQVVDHREEVYGSVEDIIKEYKRESGLYLPGGQLDIDQGIDRKFLGTCFNGIYNGLTFLLHLTSDRDAVAYFKNFIYNPEYKNTLSARVEYMDALIDLAHTASMALRGKTKIDSKSTYDASDLNTWSILRDNFRTVSELKYPSEGSVLPSNCLGVIDSAINQVLRAAKSFIRTTRYLSDEGISNLCIAYEKTKS
ncbi:MAG: hypothetical protein ABIJ08_07220 [Nanoarchaeota archaeon]